MICPGCKLGSVYVNSVQHYNLPFPPTFYILGNISWLRAVQLGATVLEAKSLNTFTPTQVQRGELLEALPEAEKPSEKAIVGINHK